MSEYFELIEQAKTDNKALEKLLKENEPLIYSLVKNYSIVGYTTEDLMQEARQSFCTAVRKFDATRGYQLSTFVSVVIRRRLDDIKGTQFADKRRGEVFSLLSDNEDEMEYEIPSPDPNPEEQVLIEEKREEIGNALRGKLSKIEFDIAILFANGYTYVDIAKLLNITKKQVDNALQRVRKKLKD